ncbi:MAG: SUMF1/EgtB/PvdO family nonheme iron enzyme [Treponema sp.]|nr:SUMF1/EgtB/PvdO family nonheme iron enzyme [Treponema sp.]
MKKKLLILFTCLICTSVFAQVKQIDSTELVQILEKNKNKDIIFMSEISLNNMSWDYEGNLRLPSIDSEKYNLIAEIEIDFLRDRLNYKNLSKYKVSFQLKSNKPKVYAVTKIEGIETVAEYKARLEAERLAQLEAEQLAQLEAERLAEEKRLEEERIAAEKRLEEERIAAEKRKIEAARIMEEKKQRSAKYLPTYEAHLSKAKKYESEKRWCYALGSYYDAMGTVGVDPEFKSEAVKGYNLLKEAILSGNPGLGTYDEFTIFEEWKKLLIDAEKYGCSFNPYLVQVGELIKGKLDYQTKTATYRAQIKAYRSYRYKHTLEIIEEGYKKAYKYDWDKLPAEWPKYSVSYNNDGVYNVNGACVYRVDIYDNYHKKTIQYAYNPFASDFAFVDCKFNIVDENGKELIKSKRCLFGVENYIEFNGIPSQIMNLIDNKKAFLNPVECYLEYGKYNKYDDTGGRSFIKNFPEIQLPMNTAEFICWNNKFDKTYDSIKILKEYEKRQKEYEKRQKLLAVDREKLDSINFEMIKIPGQNFEMSKTEITQELYKSVMGENPSRVKGANNPVECVSWYDAIWFCNKLSIAKGYEPVYSVDGNTDIIKWNYTPHQGNSIKGEITQNTSANGYRLPTVEEWQYAVKGGEDYTYAGSNEIDEVAWYEGNSNDKTHPVAQKKANGYSLYDMSGNVFEWCWDSYNSYYRYGCGGSWHDNDGYCKVSYSGCSIAYDQDNNIGFRIIRSVK